MREEIIAELIDKTIGKVTLDAAIADLMAAELAEENGSSAEAAKAAVAATKVAFTACEKQLDLLLGMRL